MSKKKKQEEDKKNSQSKKNKYFQIVVVLVFVVIGGYFIYSTFIGSKVEDGKSDVLKDYSAFQFTKEGELTFISKEGKFISKIDVEIAEDDKSRAQGLMYRNKMLESQGMLFIFGFETRQSFWMHNTPLPLDMIFVNKKNEIVTIRKNAIPFDESAYPSTAPAIYVIEVNAGYSDKFGIEEGDKITWRRM